MLVSEAVKILEPLLMNQERFPISMKRGEESLGKVSAVGIIPNKHAYLVSERDRKVGAPCTIRQVYNILSQATECELLCHVEGKELGILNFSNGLSDMGCAMYFGGCSVFV